MPIIDTMSNGRPTSTPELDSTCEECGYSLRGLPVDATVCPECGMAFDRAQPWHAVQWPGQWSIAVRLFGPLAVVLVVLLALAPHRGIRNWLLWPLWSIWLLAILVFAVLQPWSTANQLATVSEPRQLRRAAARRLWIPAIVVNLIAAAIAIGLFFVMLRFSRPV